MHVWPVNYRSSAILYKVGMLCHVSIHKGTNAAGWENEYQLRFILFHSRCCLSVFAYDLPELVLDCLS